MAVKRYKDSFWQIDFWLDKKKGRRIRRVLPAAVKTREEAESIEQLLRESLKRQPLDAFSKNATLNRLAPTFFDYCKMHLKAKTAKDIKSSFENHVLPLMGHLIASSVGPYDFHLYKKMRLDKGGTPRSINKEIDYIGSFYKWGAKNKVLPPLAFPREKLPYRRPIPKVLTFEEAVKLIKAAVPASRRVMLLMLYSLGLRMDEVRNVQWEDIDMGSRTVLIRGKGGKERLLPFGRWLHDELQAASEEQAGARGYLFLNRSTGRPVGDIGKTIANAKKVAGITKRVHPHLLRHSFATHLLDNGTDIRVIQRLLGHADISTTQWYAQVTSKSMRTAVERLYPEELMSPVSPRCPPLNPPRYIYTP